MGKFFRCAASCDGSSCFQLTSTFAIDVAWASSPQPCRTRHSFGFAGVLAVLLCDLSSFRHGLYLTSDIGFTIQQGEIKATVNKLTIAFYFLPFCQLTNSRTLLKLVKFGGESYALILFA